MKRLFMFFIFAACLAGCKSREVDITGTWLQPIPGRESGFQQGMYLHSDGKASSVNMYTLVLDSWERDGDRLILKGKSVGNRIAFPFTDTLIIDKRTTEDTLFLRQGENVQIFTRYRVDR